MLITRGLGLVNPAEKRDTQLALFSDWDAVPDWEKGWVGELFDIGVLPEDPNNTVRVGDPISLGELCEMLCRAYDYMIEGIDETIRVEGIWHEYGEKHTMMAWLPVPVQIVDGLIYIPIRSYYQTGIDFSHDRKQTVPKTFCFGYWYKNLQKYICEYAGGYQCSYWSGGAEYAIRSGLNNIDTALGPIRLLFGEVMFPIMRADDEQFYDGVVHVEIRQPRFLS